MFTTFSSASIADFEQANGCWHVTIETLCKVYCNSDIKTQKNLQNLFESNSRHWNKDVRFASV